MDAAELIPDDTFEEGVGFDFVGALLAKSGSKTVGDIAEETVSMD